MQLKVGNQGWRVKNARITIKNYRGFSDQEPASFEIGAGFTAFVGKNNAGKSSAKLVFYELRAQLAALAEMTEVDPKPGTMDRRS